MAHDILIGADEDLASQLATEPRGYPNDLFSRHTSPFDPLPLGNSRFSPDGTSRPTLADSGIGNEYEGPRKDVAKEPKEPLYKRKWFIITNIVVALLSIAILFILLYPVVHAIAQHLVNAAVLHVDQAIITNPTNQSFDLSLNAWISHGGIFSATVKFNEPIAVLWTNSTGDQVQLGSFLLDPLTIKNMRAYINETVPFSIDDETAFSQFTSALITEQNFTWHLTSEKVDVRALKFLTAHELKFQKDVALSGMNNFQDEITLVDLQLPRDAPGGGIEFVAVTGIQNPSPFSIDLGTVVFDLSYDGLYLGSGSGYNTTVGSGGNNVTLRGTLVPQNSSDSLSKVSQLFTEYLNAGNPEVLARGRSSFQNDGNAVSWLSSGLTALQLTVPFKAPGPISPIKSISIGEMALVFSEQNAWAPIASSRSVQAELELPFGFNVSIGQLSNSFNITDEGSVVSGLSAPPSASVSQIDVVNSTCTRGTVNITIDDTPLAIPDASHPIFSVFTRNLTNSSSLPFQLEGNARAVADTSIGQLTLDPIIFIVASSLKGLQGLEQLVDIGTVDVIGGSTEAIHLSIPMNIQNPSNLVLSTGDLSLQLFRYGALLGTILIPNMTLQRGNNSFSAQGNFTPNDTPQGMRTLNEFVGGTDVEVAASGYGQSTPIESLVSAFESLNVSASLPALEANLIGSASLSVLDTTSQQNNTVHATVSLTNPFTAELAITHVNSNISFHSISLGTIDEPVAFSSKGNSTTESPALDLALNLDPEALFTVTRICAQSAGLSTDQLDAIVQLGGYQYLDNVNTARHWQMGKRNDVTFIGFNLPNYLDQVFSKLAADVNLQVGVTIGEYPTTLAYTQHNVSVKTDKSLNLLLPILAQPIVQKIVSGTVLGIETILIKDVKQNSFTASLNGSITNAGPFDANITFPMGLDLHWDGASFGNIAMPDVHVVGNAGANFQVDATVNVTNVDHLTDFTKALVTQDSINWVISGNDLTVSALGILVPGVSLPGKNVTLKGMNNLKGGVKIDSFDLPSNDPAGGIHLTLDTTVANPSQIGIALSSIEFQAFFQNTTIGPVSSSTPFSLLPLSAVSLPLSGRLVPQSSEAGLKAVSALVDGFVHGQDSDVVVQGSGAGATDATWLNEGIKALQVQATLPNQGTLDVITAVTLNELDLRFTDTTAFSPSMSSNDATAAFSLPFGFPVNIISVGQNITAGFGSTDFAQLNIPKGPCSTDVDKRIIHLQISDVPFNVLQGQTSVFEQFLSNTATSVNTTISLKGSADTEVDTAVGVLNLTAIQFNVQTSIAGMQGLTSKPTLVTALDVDHGFSDYLLIKVNSSLFNPSNITLGAGDISFDLTYQNQIIGQADLNDLTILPGNQSYAIDVHYQPHGEAVTSGQHLLENFLQGTTSSTTIQGSTDSTLIQSLQLAMSKISLSPVNIPGLGKTLISSTSLVFPPNIAQSGIAQASFVLANPFTASINLLEISATATYGNLTLGKIDNLNWSNDPIHADGHADVTSPALPFSMNMDPSSIMEFLLAAAQNNDVDLGPLPALFRAALQNPASHSSINATVGNATAPCISGHQFDVNGAILNSLKNLDVTLNVNSSVKIDDYPTDLSFVQKGVRAVTDDTALYLVGVVAPPIVQTFVDQATLSFSQANITNVSDEGFDLSLKGALTGAGPFDAQIVFVEPVSISWQGQTIATISLPPVCMAANIGVPDYETTAHLTITDTSGFTQFATFLLHNPEFEWTISTGALRAIALGTTFDGVSLSKNISFKAFNNLPGVTISDFKLPSDDPAGGIHIKTDSLIPSSADLGIELGTVAFEASFKGITLGPLSSTNLLLTAHSTTNAHLTGRITPKSGADLAVMGELFTNFLQSQNQTISIRGSSVQPAGANASVAWLSSAFQSLALNITLPGQNLEVIQAIDMSDIELVMTEENQAFAPIASAQNVVAQYKNPFGFSLQVVQSNENITLVSGGIGVAELLLPQTTANGPVSTGNVVPLLLSFDKQTMRALDDVAFSQFMATVTTTSNVDLQLKGSTDVVARTAVGDVPISGIPIDVITSIKGIDSFGHGTVLNNFSITGSGQDNTGPFIKAPLTTALSNPSNISLQTVGVELPVFYQDVMLGRAVIDSLNLQPGDNTVSAEFHYVPQDANDTTAQSFITSFLQTSNELPLTIKGDASSSPFASLIPALEGVEITTDLKGLNFPPFVTTINAYISAATLFSNTVSIDFDIANPLDTEIQVSFAQADSGLDGVTYVHFEHAFDDFVIPPHATVNSGPINNVLLTQGALGSLKILNSGKVDVFTAATVRVGAYTIPWLHLTTLGAPITVHPSL